MLTSFSAVVLIIFGTVNLTSDQSGFVGWLLLIIGLVLLITKLSGPPKPKKRGKGNSGGAHYSQSYDGSSSDFSGGDGGGGGD